MTAKQVDYQLRPMQATDNAKVAHIIRTVMTEFGCVGDGYSIEDPEVDNMFEAYSGARAIFFALTADDVVIGCGGIAPLDGGDPAVCELRKMYFLPEARGKGFGRKMLELCLGTGKDLGYEKCYLETVERMASANALYTKAGFKALTNNLGATGHCSCDAFYVKDL